MNSFSNFGSMLGRGSQNVNSISYINRYAKKNIKFDFSGSSFSDLSYNPYAVTSAGLNMTNINNATIARLKLNNDYLKSTDFTSSSFTIYLKHAARYSNASPFNFAYPSAVTVSHAVVLSGSDFSANFYSLLDPGTPLPYEFSGCTTTELNGTSLTGTVTAPYGTVTKTFTRANYAIFPTVVPQSLTISCGAPLPVTTYAVTVSGDNLFYIDGLRQLPTMTAGNVYLFDQSNSSNIGNTLVFGTTLDSPSYYTTGVFTNGTAGSEGAYTLLNYTDATPSGLLYYSRQNSGMGYEPPFDTAYCVTWLDATAYGPTDATTITVNNISDKSPRGSTVNKMIGTITYNSNALKTGYAGLSFVDGAITFNMPANTFINGASVFAVYKSLGTTAILTRTTVYAQYFDSEDSRRAFRTGLNNTVETYVDVNMYSTRPTLYSSILDNKTNNLLSFDERSYDEFAVQQSKLSYNSSATDNATIITIGGSSVYTSTTCVFSEVIVFNTAISFTERLKIEGYLAWRWALTAFLGFGHPYKYKSTLPPFPMPVVWYKFDEYTAAATHGGTATNFGDSGLNVTGFFTNNPAKISYSTTNPKYGISSLYSSSTSNTDNSFFSVPIKYTTSSDYPAGITISFWVKFETLPTGNMIIMGNTPDTTTVSAFVCYLTSTGFRSFNESISANSAVSINTWYNYVQTYNPTTTIKKTYVNGSLLATKTLAITSHPGQFINLVNSRTASYLPLRGWLDDFRIYPEELTSAQVTSIYNNV